jgi:ABC-type proline/glycine betaine transport system substrate-binding protein
MVKNLVVLGIGEAFSEGTTGLVVPALCNHSIEELNANKDKFKGEIIGIGGGFMLTRCKAIDCITNRTQW